MSVYIARDKAGNVKSPFWQYDFQCRGARFSGSLDGQDGRAEVRVDRPRKEAERAEAVIRDAATKARPSRERITLHDAAAHYWTNSAQHWKSADSEWGYIAHVERLIGRHTYIDELTDAAVAKMVARRRTETPRRQAHARRGQPISNASVNRCTETLQRIVGSVSKTACMPEAMPDWGKHRLAETKRVRSLSYDEDAALFASIAKLRPDFHDIWDFTLKVGKRLSEVLFLEKAKIDRRARTARVIAKGGKEIVIALTDAAMEIVNRNWMNHPTRLFTFVAQANFTSADGNVVRRKGRRYPFTIDGWREPWKEILEDAGITDFRVHDFRHTTATRVLAATGNLKAVQDVLDHEDIRSSARYAHLFTDDRRAALEAAERLRLPENPRKPKARKSKL